MIALLNKELVDKLKKEAICILALFALGIIIFKAIFYKEQLVVVIKFLSGFFWLFVLPGFSLMYYWHNKLDFTERFLIGIATSMALVGIISYHLGVIGLHVVYHALVIPSILLVLGSVVIWKKLFSN